MWGCKFRECKSWIDSCRVFNFIRICFMVCYFVEYEEWFGFKLMYFNLLILNFIKNMDNFWGFKGEFIYFDFMRKC